ncbi:peptidoglycan DD-metalloendopeptidase family protein [Streptomyces sp. NPDC021098]|uniref:peptidoglycan DD-metalloendopeptidase family protein n=1 Tax=unclassified Streptomyces TaxID=2593676 RepID=UPI0037BCB146
MRRPGAVWAPALCVLMWVFLMCVFRVSAEAVPSAAPTSDARSWPVAGPEGALRPSVLRAWRPPPAPWAPGHRGVDLAARAGQVVRAAAAGQVSFAGPVAGRGVLTIELSGSGDPPLRTSYEPVRATAAKGARVAAGQVVGVVEAGPFHCPAGCLHWGLRRGDRYLDPLSLLPRSMLRGGPSRLLPVFGVPPVAEGATESPLPATGARPRLAATASPTAPSGLAPCAALAAAAAWSGRRLRSSSRPDAAPSPGRWPRGLSRGRRSGPWRPPPP